MVPHRGNIVIQFEKSVSTNGDATALLFDNKNLTYQQLNDYANQLAHYLVQKGILPGDCVAIACTRGFFQWIAILAILKVRAMYLPLDLQGPPTRTEFVLADIQPKLIITQQILAFAYPQFVFESLDILSDYSVANLNLDYHCNDLAYVIYTSGSTGKPKGVLIEHHSVCNVARFIARECGIRPKVRVLQFGSVCFDISVGEWASTLLYGGELVLISESQLPPHCNIAQVLLQQKINIAFLTPTVISTFSTQQLPDLKILVSGGEALSQMLSDLWSDKLILINAYGPTETTIITSWSRCVPGQKVHLGKPLDQMQLMLIDQHDQVITKINQQGEIIIAGTGIARGYTNNLGLTQQKFNTLKLNHPNYRSGDFGYYDDEYHLIYVGRRDGQVKLRGFRIELGEIVNALESYPGVQRAVVKLQGAHEYNRRLVAFYITMPDVVFDQSDLQKAMQQRLPAHMLPGFYHQMTEFPQTSNGKIDLAALPDISPIATIAADNSNNLSDISQRILKIWQAILNIIDQPMSVHSDFFALGGNSISLTQLLTKIQLEFNCQITLNEFLRDPTITGLERLILHPHLSHGDDDLTLAMQDKKVQLIIQENIQSISTRSSPQHILLTGASGFLGVHLLRELMLQTNAQIYCLIRAENAKTALEKLQSNLAYHRILQDIDINRLVIIVGDLEQTHLGLEAAVWRYLCETVDVIVHNGAKVHHILNYSQLRHANVLSTQQLLLLAATHHRKIFNYVSTVSAIHPFNANGYALSKWVSERLVTGQSNLDTCIFRPGNITGDSRYGIQPTEHNHALLLMKGCAQMRCAPLWDMNLEMTPVDIVANSIVSLMLQVGVAGKIFNLNNPHKLCWPDYITILNQHGLKIELLEYTSWQQQLKNQNLDNALFPLKFLYLNGGSAGNQFDYHNNALAKLNALNIHYPDDYPRLIALYMDFFFKVKFL